VVSTASASRIITALLHLSSAGPQKPLRFVDLPLNSFAGEAHCPTFPPSSPVSSLREPVSRPMWHYRYRLAEGDRRAPNRIQLESSRHPSYHSLENRPCACRFLGLSEG